MAAFQRAMIIDDDPVFGAFAEGLLEDSGIAHVRCTQSAQDVIDAIKHDGGPDLLMCDLNMPVQDGVTILRQLADLKFKGAVAIVSGEAPSVIATVAKLAKLQGLNILGGARKPLDPDSLQQLLQSKLRPAYSAGATIGRDDLELSLRDHRVSPYFQAKVSAASGKVVSAEALARFTANDGVIHGPASFIKVAEKGGLMAPLTTLMLERSVEAARTCLAMNQDLTFAVNVSPTLLYDLELPDRMADIVAAAGLQCSSFVLEITESDQLDVDAAALDVMTRLRIKGFGLSADDFGTGHSNLERLRDVPFTELKIDRSFVTNVLTDAFSRSCVGSCVRFGRNLGVAVVAEGVETEETWACLREAGVDMGQGYHLHRPASQDDFIAFLSSQ